MVKCTRTVLWVKPFRDSPSRLIQQHQPCQSLLLPALKQCCNIGELEYGKRIHDKLTQYGTEPGTFLLNILVELYRRCQSMSLARQVFESMTHKNVVTWNSLIMGYVENGESQTALKLFDTMDCHANHVTYLAALKACTALATEEALHRGADVHRRVVDGGFAANTAVSNTLITMYSRCRDMASARDVFLETATKDVVSWTCLMMGYVENGESHRALELFWSMDCEPDYVTCLSALKACVRLASGKLPEEKERALETGVAIHKLVTRYRFDSNVFVNNTLVDMYCKCGDMFLAKQLFDVLKNRDVVTWNCLIQGYVENGEPSQALELFTSMDCQPNTVTFLGVLKACAALAKGKESATFLTKAKAIHERIKVLQLASETTIANMLLEMYCKYGETELAEETFKGMVRKNVVSWTCLMAGYVENGESHKALEAFSRMDCQPDQVSCVLALRACIKLSFTVETPSEKERLLERGVAVHKVAEDSGLAGEVLLENTLLELYRRCGDMHRCREKFKRMRCRNVVTWNTLILGYIDNGEHILALQTFGCMDCEPNHFTFLAALKAWTGMSCATSERLEKGVALHGRIRESAFASNLALASGLVDLYSKCGEMKEARDVFENSSSKDVVLWNTLMSGYIENGESLSALELFSRMDCKPNHVTYLAMLKACGSLAVENPSDREIILKKGISFHEKIKEAAALHSNVMVSCSLIDMYSKCGDMNLAREVFDKMAEKSPVAWNSLLLGYVEKGESLTALDLLTRIDCQPDHVTFVAAIKACASLAGEMEKEKALREGLAIHGRVRELGFDSNVFLASTLVDMYSKCGEIHLAREVFEGMMRKDVVTWNCLILGYAENDESWLALELFSRMDCEPTPVTYLAVLKACSRVAAVAFGRMIHGTVCKLGLEEEIVMATGLVDLYGSCGCMSTAAHVFDGMRSPGLASWNALMARYSSLGDVSQVFNTARKAQETGIQLDSISFIHILTACGHAGLVEQGEKCFESMRRQGLKPAADHYNCMVDMLGRANKLEEAISTVKEMPEANEVTWMTLLGACRKWNNLEIGRVAFDAIVTGERRHTSAAAYVIMADIYGRLGMWRQQEEMVHAKIQNGGV